MRSNPIAALRASRLQWLPSPLAFCLLLATGLLVYANSFSAAFVFDDVPDILHNRLIRQPWPPTVFLLHSERPLVDLTLAVNYAWNGFRPESYHLFNVAVHILAAAVLFGLVRRTLLGPNFHGRYASSAFWLGLTVGLIWLIHPLQTQAVTYTIQRAESMMGLFYLLTLYCSARTHSAVGPVWWKAGAVVSCALGMASKPIMVTAPAMVVLYDWVFYSSPCRQGLRKRIGFYLALAATTLILSRPLLLRLATTGPQSVGFGIESLPPWSYASEQPVILLHYLKLSVWPHPLVFDYAWTLQPLFSLWKCVATGIVAAGLLIVVIGCIRRSALAFSGAWFFLILAPSSSIIPLIDLALEHRMYLPLASVVAFLVVR